MTEPATCQDKDNWEEEEQAAQLMDLEDRVANRVDELEEQLAKLEREMEQINKTNVLVATWQMFLGKVDEGLGWIEERQYELEEWLDAMEDGGNQRDESEKGSSRSTSPLMTAPQSYAASETAPTRSPSVSLSGSGSHGEMRMDFPPTRADSEIPAVAENLGSASAPRESSLPQVNIIPATPQSSQKDARSHVAPPILRPTPPPATSSSWSTVAPTAVPTAALSTSLPPPQWEDVLPPPPWQENVTPEQVSGRPAASMSLLAPPAADAGHPKSPRQVRSRSPSPAPTRRSPRLQSPVPTPTSTPAAPTGQHEGLGNSMEIDK